jgi:hypothetical protein
LANTTDRIPDEQRPAVGQSVPLGDTGDGDTGVPAREQGISNRPGDRAGEIIAEENENDDEVESEDEEDDEDDEDEDDDEDDDLKDEEDEEDEEDETTEPGSEPGKPM